MTPKNTDESKEMASVDVIVIDPSKLEAFSSDATDMKFDSSDMCEASLDVDELGRSNILNLGSFRRPHMRAFHLAWIASFVCNFAWFSISPFQKGIMSRQETAWLTDRNFNIQNTLSLCGPVFARIVIGPLVDRYGPRFALSFSMVVFSIPVFLIGTSHSFWQWAVARFFIGFLAGEQAATQSWTSHMFSSTTLGTATSTVVGWGDMGSGICSVLLPQISNLIVKAGASEDQAWRITMVIPGCMLVLVALLIQFTAEDLPSGSYNEIQITDEKKAVNPFKSLGRAALNWRVWILFLQNACSFGVQVFFYGNLATYMQDVFGVQQGTAGLIVGLVALPSIAACSAGGMISDAMATRFGLNGRIVALFCFLMVQGLAVVTFSQLRLLSLAIAVVPIISILLLLTVGIVYSIAPFVDPEITGAVNGIVGAGSSVGGAVLGAIVLGGGEQNITGRLMMCGIAISVQAVSVGLLNVIFGGWVTLDSAPTTMTEFDTDENLEKFSQFDRSDKSSEKSLSDSETSSV